MIIKFKCKHCDKENIVKVSELEQSIYSDPHDPYNECFQCAWCSNVQLIASTKVDILEHNKLIKSTYIEDIDDYIAEGGLFHNEYFNKR